MSQAERERLMKKKEFAEYVGISPSNVTRGVNSGRILTWKDSHPMEFRAKLAKAETDDEKRAIQKLGETMIDPKSQAKRWRDTSKRPDRTQAYIKQSAEKNGTNIEFVNSGDARIVSDSENHDIEYYRLQKEKAQARKIELHNAQVEGDLIPRAVVNSVLFPFIRSVRESIMSIPDRCAASIAASVRGVLPESFKMDQDSLQILVRSGLNEEIMTILLEVSRAEGWEDEAKTYIDK